MMEFISTVTEWFGPVSFKVEPGAIVKVVAPTKAAVEGFTKTAAGLIKPLSGQVTLWGRDIYAAGEEEYLAIMRDVGVVRETGGVISNLKVWENVALPALYHGKMTLERLEAITEEVLASVGISRAEGEELMGLYFSDINPFHARIFKMIRAFGAGPALMIHEEIASSLPAEAAKSVIGLAMRFHGQGQGRASMFVTREEASLKTLPPAPTIYLAAP